MKKRTLFVSLILYFFQLITEGKCSGGMQMCKQIREPEARMVIVEHQICISRIILNSILCSIEQPYHLNKNV